MAAIITDTLRSVMINVVRQCLGGTGGTGGTNGTSAILKVYGGDRPFSPDTTAGTQGIIVQINNIGWAAASNGTAALGASYTGTAIDTRSAVWARLSDNTGTAFVVDGLCGTSLVTCDFIINKIAISTGDVITLSIASIIQPTGA